MDLPIQLIVLVGAAALIIFLLIVAGLRRTSRPRPSRLPYIEGLKALVNGNDELAFQMLQESVRSGAAPVDAYIKLGRLLRERGDVTKALQIHQSLTVKTTLSKAEKVELFQNLAEDYGRMGNSEKAASVLESAIRNLGIRDPAIYIALARHKHKLGESEQAYDILREARKHGGTSESDLAMFLASVAEPMVESGDPKEMRKLLQRALKHDNRCAKAHLLLGDLAERTGNVDEAIQRWKDAALLSPELAEPVLQKLESSLFERGRFSEIEKIYDEVRRVRWDEAASLSLARFYNKQGRGEDAIELLEDFLSVHPESVRGALLLASFYARFRPEMLQDFLEKSISDSTHGSASTNDEGSFHFDALATRQES